VPADPVQDMAVVVTTAQTIAITPPVSKIKIPIMTLNAKINQ
jgi:hypothetical protein